MPRLPKEIELIGDIFSNRTVFIILFGCFLGGGIMGMKGGGFFSSYHEENYEETYVPRFGDGMRKPLSTLVIWENKEGDTLMKALKFPDSGKFRDELRQCFSHLQNKPFSYSVYYGKTLLLLKSWAKTSPREAIEALDSMGESYKISLMPAIFQTWGENDPEGLAQYYWENRNRFYNDEDILNATLSGWARTAPLDAVKWLSTLNRTEQRTGISALLESTALYGVSNMAKTIEAIPNELLNDPDILAKTMRTWAMSDPSSAISWKNNLSPEQQELLGDYGHISNSSSLVSALKHSLSEPGNLVEKIAEYPFADQKNIWKNFLTDLASNEGIEKAREWREKYLPQNMKDELSWIYEMWDDGNETQQSLQEKIKNTPSDFIRKDLLSSYQEYYAGDDYSTAASFLALENEVAALQQLLEKWACDDFDEMEFWLDSGNVFSQEKKQEMKRSLKRSSLVIPKRS